MDLCVNRPLRSKTLFELLLANIAVLTFWCLSSYEVV